MQNTIRLTTRWLSKAYPAGAGGGGIVGSGGGGALGADGDAAIFGVDIDALTAPRTPTASTLTANSAKTHCHTGIVVRWCACRAARRVVQTTVRAGAIVVREGIVRREPARDADGRSGARRRAGEIEGRGPAEIRTLMRANVTGQTSTSNCQRESLTAVLLTSH
jgi:hypothetical protein